ncbi:hypothetical protein ACP4OV_017537 [Aristida adscensionis]
MSTAVAPAGETPDGQDRRRRELQAFDDTKAGVKGLVDAGATSVPAIFRHSPESLHHEAPPPSSAAAAIPVVDLYAALREEVVDLVRATAKTVGFFQVVNHGVAGELLVRMLAAVRRFHEAPAEAKRPYYTRDTTRKVRFTSNFHLFQSSAANWRDNVTCDLAPPPLPEELPEALRDVIMEYAGAVRKLALLLLELLSESLGLASDYLLKMECAESLSVVSHYYPPCPEPHVTLGTGRHTDPTFLTVLLQDAMGGLQVLVDHGGGHQRWVDVPRLPGALIVNVGDLLQLVSNGKFRSVEHRVLANQSMDTPRISVAFFFDGRRSVRFYGPIEELTSPEGGNSPFYRSITVREFLAHFYKKGIENRHSLDDHFKLEQHTPM